MLYARTWSVVLNKRKIFCGAKLFVISCMRTATDLKESKFRGSVWYSIWLRNKTVIFKVVAHGRWSLYERVDCCHSLINIRVNLIWIKNQTEPNDMLRFSSKCEVMQDIWIFNLVRPHESGEFWKGVFFYTNMSSLLTKPVNPLT